MKAIIECEQAPMPIGPYSQAVLAKDFVFLSGQIPLNVATGEIEGQNIEVQTIRVLENVKAILNQSGLNFSNVVKTTIFLTDLQNFYKVNDIYKEYFSESAPARSCIEVSKLPMGALIEIEIIACTT